MALSGENSIESLTKFVVNTLNAAFLERAPLNGNICQADVGEILKVVLCCNPIQRRKTIGTSEHNEISLSTRDCT
jgi:hypothetical protein